MIEHVNSGKLKPVLEEAFPLDKLAQAQATFVKRSHFGKFVIDAS